MPDAQIPASSHQAHARVGLLGNPSDGYGGKVLAFALANFRATVTVRATAGVRLQPDTPHAVSGPTWQDIVEPMRAGRLDGGAQLLAAAIAVFAQHTRRLGVAVQGFELEFESNIPRQVGLAGSSAIVIAALRALASHHRVPIAPAELAELALRAETVELGIAAGPQDRVIQANQGLMWMDFSQPGGPGSYVALDPALLPPMFVAWDRHPGTSSTVIHDDVRARFDRGDPAVIEAITRFPQLAEEGHRCLVSGDLNRFRALVDINFDTRASIWTLRDRDRELVDIGRRLGAAVKFTGSGGAVIGMPAQVDELPQLASAYDSAGFGFIDPRVAAALAEPHDKQSNGPA